MAIVDLPSQQVGEAHCSILVVANFSSQSNKGIINNSLRIVGTELVGGQAQVSDSKMANMLNMAAQVGEVHQEKGGEDINPVCNRMGLENF